MKKFENDWQSKFGDWEVKPPEDVWANIEKELDKDKKKPIVFFWTKTAGMGIAASLLLMGVWLGPKILNKGQKINFAQTNPKELPKTTATPTGTPQRTISAKLALVRPLNKVLLETALLNDDQIADKPLNLETKTEIQDSGKIEVASALAHDSTKTPSSTASTIASAIVPVPNVDIVPNKSAPIQRTKPTEKVAQLTQTPSPKEKEKKLWLSLNTGLVSLNTRFGDDLLGSAFSKSDVGFASSDQAEIGSSPGTGSRYGLNIEMKIAKKLRLESGLSFTQANSFIRANAFAVDKFTGETNVFLTSYLSKNAQESMATPAGTDKQAVSNDLLYVGQAQRFVNNYRFLSIPNQLLFTALKKSKIAFSIGGGLSTDVLTRNTIGDVAQGGSRIDFAGTDGVYKFISFSGLGSARLSYQINKNLASGFNVTGQSGLGNFLKPNQPTALKLKQTSINYSLQYSIK